MKTAEPSTHRTTNNDNPSVHPRSISKFRLLEGNETGGVGGTDTGSTVLDGLAVRLLERTLRLHFPLEGTRREGKTYYVMENSPR